MHLTPLLVRDEDEQMRMNHYIFSGETRFFVVSHSGMKMPQIVEYKREKFDTWLVF